jgi:flagellar operon protein
MYAVKVQHLDPNRGLLPNNGVRQTQSGDGQFREILEESLDKSNAPAIKFSSHAINRLQARNITVTNEDVKHLSNAVQKASDKGSRDSLVIMNDLAFIVSVKNKTVVTALTRDQMNDNVITNIDSTVIV